MQYFSGRKIKLVLVVILALIAGIAIYFFRNNSGQPGPFATTGPSSVAADSQKTDSVPITSEILSPTITNQEPDQPAAAELDKTTSVVSGTETKNAETKAQEPNPAKETAAPNPSMETERFVVALGANGVDQISDALVAQEFIKDREVFKRHFALTAVDPGGYKLAKEMSVAQIATTLKQTPCMKWIVIPEGLRKEEIAVLLADALGWTPAQENKWVAAYTQMKADNIEGVYFPDTYLIPVDEPPLDVANRLVAKFNEKFAVYLPEFTAQNIKWTTGLTLASIVQREAANTSQMPLVAGILWNRLDQGMALNVDATLQYARGNAGNGWWAAIGVSDKQIESPYNTYKHKGLPPHPICNPGIPAIEAVLNPEKTDCLYYLHGSDGQIHCTKTYEDHQANIEQYLKSAD